MSGEVPESLRGRIDRATFRARRAVPGVLNRWLDWRLGVETTGLVYQQSLGFSGEHQVHYEGSDWLTTRQALRRIGPGPDDVFLDLGVGKGRSLLLAARFPFRRIIGVELSGELAEVARRNVTPLDLPGRPVEVVHGDATTYEVPDDVTVVYLYNPFSGPVFHAALENVLRSWDRRPRALRIVYFYPYEHTTLLETRRVWPVAVTRRPWLFGRMEDGEVAVTYRVGAPGSVDLDALAARGAGLLGPWAGPHDPGFTLRPGAATTS